MAGDRKRDAQATRGRILDVARRHFATYSYDRTTVRAVAADAGVSPNLITRYFGGKKGLFVVATDMELHVSDSLTGPRGQVGDRMAASVVSRWEPVRGADPVLTMLRAAMSDPREAQRMADFFRHQATEPLAEYLGGADGWERASAMSVLIMGTVVQRYVLRAGPVARASAHELTNWLGAALQQLANAEQMPSLGHLP